MSGAYYNENDPKAAAWLRELIKAGHIAPGEVDERSIVDVAPNDLQSFQQVHWFAGIGVWSYALRLAGWPDHRPVWTGSCPCQPFSQAGKGAGTDDERHLWPYWEHLISECRPPVIFGEQVASKAADSWADLVQDDLEALGYAFGAVPFPAASVGAPHIRDRLYWVAHLEGIGRREECADAGRIAAGDRTQGRAAGLESSGGNSSELADTDGRYAGAEGLQRGGQHGLIAPDGGAGRLADDDDAGRIEHAQRDGEQIAGREAAARRDDSGGRGGHGELAHDTKQRWESRGWIAESGDGRNASRVESGRLRDAGDGVVGHHHHQGLEGRSLSTGGRAGECTPWSASDFVWCRDGKWRPVEPGTFPLAHGAPARVGRLRGYGNAIVSEAAKVFIEASGLV